MSSLVYFQTVDDLQPISPPRHYRTENDEKITNMMFPPERTFSPQNVEAKTLRDVLFLRGALLLRHLLLLSDVCLLDIRWLTDVHVFLEMFSCLELFSDMSPGSQMFSWRTQTKIPMMTRCYKRTLLLIEPLFSSCGFLPSPPV